MVPFCAVGPSIIGGYVSSTEDAGEKRRQFLMGVIVSVLSVAALFAIVE